MSVRHASKDMKCSKNCKNRSCKTASSTAACLAHVAHVASPTFPLLHHRAWLRQGEALHGLISLARFGTSAYVLQNIMWRFHQHTAIKCMAFLSLGLICPSNSINFGRQIERSFESLWFRLWPSSRIQAAFFHYTRVLFSHYTPFPWYRLCQHFKVAIQ